MTAIPDQPLIHRSWLTRGHFHPGPWAQSPQPLLMDTTVTFSRAGRAENGGSWESTGEVDFLTVQAHVEIADTSYVTDDIGNDAVGFITKRYYSIILPTPVDTDDHPKMQDRVKFTDAIGTFRNIVIDTVTLPENMPHHLEIATDTWE